MRKRLLTLAGLAMFVVGCSQQHAKMDMSMPEKPEPAPELRKLERFVGTWSGEAEMVGSMAEALKREMPAGSELKFAGGGTWDWTMGGMYLRMDGWHSMGDGQKMNMIEYITWDPKMQRYRSFYFSDWGEIGEGFMKLSDDGDSFTSEARMIDSKGNKSTGTGTMRFVDNNTLEWTWKESNGLEFKGTSKRQM